MAATADDADADAFAIDDADALDADPEHEEEMPAIKHETSKQRSDLETRRNRMFLNVLFAQLLINCDYGILAAAIVHVRKTLHMSWLGIGSLSSIIYFTLSLTTVPVGFVLQRWPGSIRKMLGVCLVLNGLCSICCGAAPTAAILTALLGLDGVCQSIPYVYFPVWVNANAPGSASTAWMGYLQNVAQVGTIAGYAGTALLMHLYDDAWWRLAFVAQGLCIILASALLMRMDAADMLLSDELGLPTRVPLAFEASAHATIRLLCRFRRHRAFWHTMFAAGVLYFVGNGLNYWTSIYFVKELHSGARAADVISVVVSTIGPVFGTWAGARYVDLIGGYKSNHARALEACLALSFVAALFLPPMCFSKSVPVVSAALLAMLAVVSALTPALAGIVLDILPEELRPLASGMYGLGTNMLGFGMSTFLGGGAIHVTGSIRFGWRFNASVILLCPVLLVAARATIGLQTPLRLIARETLATVRAWASGTELSSTPTGGGVG